MLKRLSSDKLPSPVGCYCIATECDGLIYTSGQLPIDPKNNKLVESDILKQTKQSLNNIKTILEENGSDLDNIIKATVYLKNIDDFQKFDSIYREFFVNSIPSRTAFEVGNLPLNALIEIEVIAKIK